MAPAWSPLSWSLFFRTLSFGYMIDPHLHERLLRKIQIRERFESELRKEFGDEPGLDESLSRLKSQGFLDDRRAAEAFVRAKGPASRTYLETLLVEKGVDASEILADHDDMASARAIVEKRKNDPPARVARYLASRGFEADVIESVIAFPNTE
ncbi:RecX family transcriptional regulator [bacterium]|nr:MAG: RecX family transcriptional regulator [bacterium]